MSVLEKEFVTELIDLKSLNPDDSVWDQLLSLTVRGWAAKDEFELIRNGKYKNGTFSVLLVFDDETPIAWGMRACFDEKTLHPNLWLYTHPEYRRLGIQKDIVIPYWNKTGEEFVVFGSDSRQKKTFKYVEKKQSVT